MVKTLGNQLLARSALADHEHWPIERRGPARPLDGVEERQALADELFRPLHMPTVGGKSHQLARIFTLFQALKVRKSQIFGLSRNVARALLSKKQV
jgi:hypothetical protein